MVRGLCRVGLRHYSAGHRVVRGDTTVVFPLEHEDLVAMLRGSFPSFKASQHPMVQPYYNRLTGAWRDLDNVALENLWAMYNVVKSNRR